MQNETPGNDIVLTFLGIMLVLTAAYATGRLHQRLRTASDRDEAYAKGYDQATQSMWALAVRPVAPSVVPVPLEEPIPAGRHHVNNAATREIRLRARL
jgi:hypothetical protein